MSAEPRQAPRRWSQRRRLTIVLTLNAALIVGLVVAGLVANSISLLAAAGDTIGDCAGLILGLIAIALRDRDPDHPHAQRPIAVAALVNALLLLVVTITVVAESAGRVMAGSPPVEGLPVVVAGAITAIVMLVGAAVLGRSAADEDIHMRSVLLDALADAGAAAGVAIGGLVILVSRGLYWIDPVLAVAISAFVGVAAIRLGLTAIASLRGRSAAFDDE